MSEKIIKRGNSKRFSLTENHLYFIMRVAVDGCLRERKFLWKSSGKCEGLRMKCPFCGKENTKVIDSRPSDDDSSIRRRRQCEKCKRRFTTYENVEIVPIVVIKKDLTREPYDRAKLQEGVFRSCIKRPIPMEKQDLLLDEIEAAIFEREKREISTTEIGEMVLERLQHLDAVAYIRFASVYRDFVDMESFQREIAKLQNRDSE